MQKKIKSFLPIVLSFVAVDSSAKSIDPVPQYGIENKGLLAKINCSSDKFDLSVEKQKTNLFQIYVNGEFVDQSKSSGSCNIGEITVSYNLSLLEEAARNCRPKGSSPEWCTYDSPSRVIVKKHGTQIAEVHMYPERKKYDSLKIESIEVDNNKVTICDSSRGDRFVCGSYTHEKLVASPLISRAEAGVVY